jgi:integrative and conjugative element protein (TIGR02256 family)
VSPAIAWWDQQALREAVAEADRAFPSETGGALLGWRAGPRQIVVSSLTGPGPKAEHAPRTFRPDARWQQEMIDEAYRRSGRTVTYLGDWHTHPSGSPTLSPRDISTLRRIARAKEARAPRAVMAVLGGGPDWTISIRQLNGAWALRTLPLQLRPFDR